MDDNVYEVLGETNASWPFNALSIRLAGRNYVAIPICVPDDPKIADVFYFEFGHTNGKWQLISIADKEDSVWDEVTNILHDYIKSVPRLFGTDFVERDLVV